MHHGTFFITVVLLYFVLWFCFALLCFVSFRLFLCLRFVFCVFVFLCYVFCCRCFFCCFSLLFVALCCFPLFRFVSFVLFLCLVLLVCCCCCCSYYTVYIYIHICQHSTRTRYAAKHPSGSGRTYYINTKLKVIQPAFTSWIGRENLCLCACKNIYMCRKRSGKNQVMKSSGSVQKKSQWPKRRG